MRTSRYEFWEEIIQPITMSLKLFSFFELLCQLSSLPRNTTLLKGRYNYYFYEVHHIHTCILQWQWKVTWGRHQRGAMGDNKQSRKKSAESTRRGASCCFHSLDSFGNSATDSNECAGWCGKCCSTEAFDFLLGQAPEGKKISENWSAPETLATKP